jgi:hypothetical protein
MNWNRINNELSEALLAADRLEEFLTELGCNLRHAPGSYIYRGRCPVHLGRNPNFEIRTHGHSLPVRWKCYSHHCEKHFKPSLLGLVWGVLNGEGMKNVSLRDAVVYLRKFVGIVPSGTKRCPKNTQTPPKRLALNRDQVRRQLHIPAPYFVARGFSPAVLDALDIGHSPKRGRSIVPIYDDEGLLCVGFLSRAEHPQCESCERFHGPDTPCQHGQSKWVVMQGFPKGEYLYNYASARGRDSRLIFLLEGPGDVVRFAEAGVPAVAAFGSDLSSVQAGKLAALRKRVFIVFDNDGAGKSGAARAADLLRKRGVHVNVAFPPELFHDVGDMTVEDILAWLNRITGMDAKTLRERGFI